MKKFIIRHGDYGDDLNLTEYGIQQSEIRGNEIRELIGDISEAQIQIVSSTAPRAFQTAENIVKGLGTTNNIHEVEELWDDNGHYGDLNKSIDFIKQLPPHLALIVISHLDFVFPVAKELGYEGEYKSLGKLGQFIIEEGDIVEDEQNKTQNIELTDDILEEQLIIEMKIPVGEKRVIKIVEAISQLQENKGWPIQINAIDGNDIVFIVPGIIPTGNPEESMKGKYDEEGFFPVTIKTDGEKHLRVIMKEKLDNNEIGKEEFSLYDNQLSGLKQFFQTFDPSIDPNKWFTSSIS